MLNKSNMDKELIKKRFAKAKNTYNQHATVQKQVADKMINLISNVCKSDIDNALEIGCGTGFLTERLVNNLQINTLLVNDISEEMVAECMKLEQNGVSMGSIVGDAESIQMPSDLCLIASCSTIQWFTDPSLFLNTACNNLKKGGVIAISSFGKSNMKELKEVTNSGIAYKSLSELTDIIGKQCDIITAEEEELTMEFDTPIDVLRHIKSTGTNGLKAKSTFSSTQGIESFSRKYSSLFSTPNGVSLTYNPIYIIAKKR
ncbi:MAG: malonyl-ACP O-methyltransferase BioC [Bacteroides sp.]|nr:malonyl-ACP O-methyltransferase BioC [Bacteroides sp.]